MIKAVLLLCLVAICFAGPFSQVPTLNINGTKLKEFLKEKIHNKTEALKDRIKNKFRGNADDEETDENGLDLTLAGPFTTIPTINTDKLKEFAKERLANKTEALKDRIKNKFRGNADDESDGNGLDLTLAGPFTTIPTINTDKLKEFAKERLHNKTEALKDRIRNKFRGNADEETDENGLEKVDWKAVWAKGQEKVRGTKKNETMTILPIETKPVSPVIISAGNNSVTTMPGPVIVTDLPAVEKTVKTTGKKDTVSILPIETKPVSPVIVADGKNTVTTMPGAVIVNLPTAEINTTGKKDTVSILPIETKPASPVIVADGKNTVTTMPGPVIANLPAVEKKN